MTLDASGKEAFAATRLGWRERDPFLNKVAVWTYYKGCRRGDGQGASRPKSAGWSGELR